MIAPPKDVAEVQNAYEIYEKLDYLDSYSVEHLLDAHGMMMRGFEMGDKTITLKTDVDLSPANIDPLLNSNANLENPCDADGWIPINNF